MRIGLFISDEEERFFSNRPAQEKNELIALISEVMLAQKLDTEDAKRKVSKLCENWSVQLADPHWDVFNELVRRFVNNELALPGDLNRRCIQILDALKAQ